MRGIGLSLLECDILKIRTQYTCSLFSYLVQLFYTCLISPSSQMPNVEGVTAIAIWMLACINFVFFALVNYAFLLWSIKYRDRKQEDNTSKEGTNNKVSLTFMIKWYEYAKFNLKKN